MMYVSSSLQIMFFFATSHCNNVANTKTGNEQLYEWRSERRVGHTLKSAMSRSVQMNEHFLFRSIVLTKLQSLFTKFHQFHPIQFCHAIPVSHISNPHINTASSPNLQWKFTIIIRLPSNWPTPLCLPFKQNQSAKSRTEFYPKQPPFRPSTSSNFPHFCC